MLNNPLMQLNTLFVGYRLDWDTTRDQGWVITSPEKGWVSNAVYRVADYWIGDLMLAIGGRNAAGRVTSFSADLSSATAPTALEIALLKPLDLDRVHRQSSKLVDFIGLCLLTSAPDATATVTASYDAADPTGEDLLPCVSFGCEGPDSNFAREKIALIVPRLLPELFADHVDWRVQSGIRHIALRWEVSAPKPSDFDEIVHRCAESGVPQSSHRLLARR